MTVTRYSWGTRPPEEWRERAHAWFTRHGIGGRYVTMPGWVEIDHDGHEIRWESYVPAPNGIEWLGNWPVTVVRSERGEGPPLPFPVPRDWSEGWPSDELFGVVDASGVHAARLDTFSATAGGPIARPHDEHTRMDQRT